MMVNTTLAALTLVILATPPVPAQTAPTSLDGLLSQAVEQEKSRDYAGAERTNWQVLLRFPDDPGDIPALYQLALFYKDGAQEASDQIAKSAPDSEWYLALRAQAFADNGRLDEAIRQYKAVLTKNPVLPGIHFELGQVYWKKKDADGALAELKLALQDDPNQPLANFYLADILTTRKDYQQAIPHLQITIAAYPKMTKAYFFLGKCYAGTGDLQQALRAFQQASELDPKYQEVHYQLYRLYARLNNREESERHLEIVKRLQQEDSSELRENIEKSSPQSTQPNTHE